jgi:hypothetical protein
MRRHVSADLEDELVAVDQRDRGRVAADEAPVAECSDLTAEGEEGANRQRPAPEAKEPAERGGVLEVQDAGRVVRPAPDPRRDQHDAAVREQLKMNAARGEAVLAASAQRRRVVLRPHSDRRRYRHLLPIVAVLALAGCGGSSSGAPTVSIPAARTYQLQPSVNGGALTLRVVQPDGAPLTRFRTGPGPHTGVHVILVRRDLGVILHRHPPVRTGGRFTVDTSSLPPGPYRVVVDVYPAEQTPQPNFQLFTTLRVPGRYTPSPLPELRTRQTVDGYHFTLRHAPALRAIEPAFLSFRVTTPDGKLARFTPWYGALAHAIFFRRGTLDYFHTHVCEPNATGCTSTLGAAKVTGKASAPGHLDVGVLVPVAGTWRLFLQCRVNRRVLTVPFTLTVR